MHELLEGGSAGFGTCRHPLYRICRRQGLRIAIARVGTHHYIDEADLVLEGGRPPSQMRREELKVELQTAISMTRKNAQRFCDNGIRKTKKLKAWQTHLKDRGTL